MVGILFWREFEVVRSEICVKCDESLDIFGLRFCKPGGSVQNSPPQFMRFKESQVIESDILLLYFLLSLPQFAGGFGCEKLGGRELKATWVEEEEKNVWMNERKSYLMDKKVMNLSLMSFNLTWFTFYSNTLRYLLFTHCPFCDILLHNLALVSHLYGHFYYNDLWETSCKDWLTTCRLCHCHLSKELWQ